MKNQLKSFIALLLTAAFTFSCSNDNAIDDDGQFSNLWNESTIKYETPEFWEEYNFLQLDDEFNYFRDWVADRYIAILSLGNQTGNGNFKVNRSTKQTTYYWIEVVYPKDNPAAVEYSAYTFTAMGCKYAGVLCPNDRSPNYTDKLSSIFDCVESDILYKDGHPFGSVEYYLNGKVLYNYNDTRKLLYDNPRLSYCTNQVYSTDADDNNRFEYLNDVNNNSLIDYLTTHDKSVKRTWANDAPQPFGGKILGDFGSLTSFLLPVNGPVPDGTIQEVIGLRYVCKESEIAQPETFFMYKNTESPAVPYLPESIWDIDDNSLWVINN